MPRTFSAILIAAFVAATGPSFAHEFDDSTGVHSPGGQKIVSALYEDQAIPEGGTEADKLTKSEIEGMKSGTGWGKLFKQLKLEGRYPEYKNLGQLISSRNRIERASHARSNNLHRTSRGATRPTKTTRIERVSRPTRPHRPDRPSRR